jgi:mono/diheme cytochrome c family protein
MNYPVWELSMGGGVLIAVVSILHVFVSHFAVGGGLWLVLTEMKANRDNDSELRGFVKKHSRFFVLLTLVFGAISGVGIWTTIGLISPHGTSALIHGYVWGWAIEWVFFFLEITAAIVYYYGWEKLSAKTHVTMGWIYWISAWMSLVIINGIITFMLTPGGWLENHDFWTGFFNPTYWPSTFIRTFAGFAIAGMFTLLTATQLARGEFRWRVTRWNAGWVFFGMIGVIVSAWWYGQITGEVWAGNEALAGRIPILPTVLKMFQLGLLITLVLSAWPLLLPKFWNRLGVVLLVLAGWLAMGAGEWSREAGRKPYTIHGYLYSTGMLVSEAAEFEESGMAAGTKWISPAAAGDEVRMGRDLFLAWCQPCHTMDGYNGLRPYLAYWNEETVASLMPRLNHLRAMMPPWHGTEDENAALTSYLMTKKPQQPGQFPDDPVHGPKKAFDVACGLCHTAFGYQSLAESFEGMDAEDIDDFLDESGDLLDEMPGYYAGVEQRELLIQYLEQLGSTPASEESETAATTTGERRQS